MRTPGDTGAMCGRYAQSRSARAIAADLGVQQVLSDVAPSWNVAPSQEVPVVLERGDDEPTRQLRTLRWGLVPWWSKPSTGDKQRRAPINARVETVLDNGMFRAAAVRRRAAIPMDGYFEWQASEHGPKTPFYLHRPDNRPIVAAGVYELWRDPSRDEDDDGGWLWTVAIITRPAIDTLGHIHDRCPVMLAPDWVDTWLDPTVTDPAAVRDLLASLPEPELEPRAVGRAVGNVRNDGPQLVEPVAGQ